MSKSDSKLIGREDLLQRLDDRLASDASVITLVGPPGVGKSALAREALRGADVEATLVCDLAAIADAESFFAALGRALRTESDGELFDAIAATLRRRNPIVLLDGFDQLVEHKRETLVRLADEVPGVLFVVTSRERLAIAGEEVVSVPPLSPAAATELFKRAGTGPAPDSDALPRLVELLDYNPLAIELAASRLSTFTPTDLLERLDRRFRVLRSRSGGSLEEAIALSWELLDPAEQSCLVQTTVFRGGFDLDAAEAVLQLDDDGWVLDVVESLVEKSLLERNARGRLGLSQSIRAFVVDHADQDPPRRRHAEYYGGFADLWSTRTWTAEDGNRAVDEIPNLVAVLDRFEDDEPALAVQAALALHALLRHRGMTPLHTEVLTRGVEAARRNEDNGSVARLLQARGELGVVTGRLREAEDDCRQAAELADHDDVRMRAIVQCAEAERRKGRATDAKTQLVQLRQAHPSRYVDAHLAGCHVELGELDAARKLLMRIDPAEPDADDVDEYLTLKRLAYAHYYLGNYEQQHRLNEEALTLAERVGDRRRVARARQGLGDAAFARGDFDAAREAYETALEEHRELGNEHLTGVLLGNLGGAEHRSDALDAAARHYHEALTMHQRAGAAPYEAVVNFALGVLEHERGHLDDAMFHYTRAIELFEQLDQADDITATRLCQAWLETERGDRESALALLEPLDHHDWRPVVDRTRAKITGGEWDQTEAMATELPGRLARALGDALRGDDVRDAELSRSLQGRLLLRWIGVRESPVSSAPSSRPDLVVGREGEWFQTTGEAVNLRRRKAHRRILDDLMRRREGDEGPLDVYDAFDLGWPGEIAEPELAAERVYWVVGVLRRLGLDGILLTSDEGYYLNPNTSVERADEPLTV